MHIYPLYITIMGGLYAVLSTLLERLVITMHRDRDYKTMVSHPPAEEPKLTMIIKPLWYLV